MKTTYPARLKKGDCIGIVSPASPIADAGRIEAGVRYLESLGYRTVVGGNVGKSDGYLAGTDEERAADLHTMFTDKRIKAILCLRGGYGTPRLLSLLQYSLIARHPKILVGYSDITALQLALWRKCRLVTFHGPMPGVEMATGMDPFTEEFFWRTVTTTRKMGSILLPSGTRPETLAPGTASGRLLGGNLSLVSSLTGTAYQPDFKNAILFLEEIHEEPYRIDRMLTHLRNAGVFKKVAGMLLGRFVDCVPVDPSTPSIPLERVLHDAAASSGKPVLAGLPFGHVPRKMTLPVGLAVRLNATKSTVEFLESAVR